MILTLLFFVFFVAFLVDGFKRLRDFFTKKFSPSRDDLPETQVLLKKCIGSFCLCFVFWLLFQAGLFAQGYENGYYWGNNWAQNNILMWDKIEDILSPGDQYVIVGEPVHYENLQGWFMFASVNGKKPIALQICSRPAKEGKCLLLTDSNGSRKVVCPVGNIGKADKDYITIPNPFAKEEQKKEAEKPPESPKEK